MSQPLLRVSLPIQWGRVCFAPTSDKAKKTTTIQQAGGNGERKRKPNDKEQQG
jgi:hypothetical protein